ncbi:MAG: KxYKxGKxW signal peptide domain-containing protein [Lactobacillaceae bacterium]|jgi:hypothetical protein|nr:KxYKxGKxW signal peptide domain-containing protein [Lactobacillaceae bacterium]
MKFEKNLVKEHKKMYKSGKNWLVAGLTLFAVAAAEIVDSSNVDSVFGGVTANADEVTTTNSNAVADATGNSIVTDSQTPSSESTNSNTDSQATAEGETATSSTKTTVSTENAGTVSTSSISTETKTQTQSDSELNQTTTNVSRADTDSQVPLANAQTATTNTDSTSVLQQILAVLPPKYKVSTDDVTKKISIAVAAGSAPETNDLNPLQTWANENGYVIDLTAVLADSLPTVNQTVTPLSSDASAPSITFKDVYATVGKTTASGTADVSGYALDATDGYHVDLSASKLTGLTIAKNTQRLNSYLLIPVSGATEMSADIVWVANSYVADFGASADWRNVSPNNSVWETPTVTSKYGTATLVPNVGSQKFQVKAQYGDTITVTIKPVSGYDISGIQNKSASVTGGWILTGSVGSETYSVPENFTLSGNAVSGWTYTWQFGNVPNDGITVGVPFYSWIGVPQQISVKSTVSNNVTPSKWNSITLTSPVMNSKADPSVSGAAIAQSSMVNATGDTGAAILNTTTGRTDNWTIPAQQGFTLQLDETIAGLPTGFSLSENSDGSYSLTTVADSSNNKWQATSEPTSTQQSINLVWSADAQKINLQFVDSADGSNVGTPIEEDGLTGQAYDFSNVTIPANYVLVSGQTLTGTYPTDGTVPTVKVLLSHATKTTTDKTTYAINFSGAGTKTPATVTQDVNWTIVTDLVTNKSTYNADVTSVDLTTPKVTGYHTDGAEISYTFTKDMDSMQSSLSKDVVYTPDFQQVAVSFVDDTDSTLTIPSQTVNGVTDGTYDLSILTLPAGYKFATTGNAYAGSFDDTSNGTTTTDSAPQKVTLHLIHDTNTSTTTTNYDVNYQGAGKLTPAKVLNPVTWDVVTDLVTNKSTYTPRTAEIKVVVPALKGYQTEQKASTINLAETDTAPTDGPVVITYTAIENPYTATFQTNTGKDLSTKQQVLDWTKTADLSFLTGENVVFTADNSPKIDGYTFVSAVATPAVADGDAGTIAFTYSADKQSLTLTSTMESNTSVPAPTWPTATVQILNPLDSTTAAPMLNSGNVKNQQIEGLSGYQVIIKIPIIDGYEIVSSKLPDSSFTLAGDSKTGYTITGNFDESQFTTYDTVPQTISLTWDGVATKYTAKFVDENGVDLTSKVSDWNANLEFKTGTDIPAQFTTSNLPVIDGYHFTKTTVSGTEITFEYALDTQKAVVTFVDDDLDGKQVGTALNLSGKTGTDIDFSTVKIPANYTLVGTLPTGTYDSKTSVDQEFTVHLAHEHKASTTTSNFVVSYIGTGSVKVPNGTKLISWNVDTDLVTNEATYTPTSTSVSVDSPTVVGYTPEKATATADLMVQTLKPADISQTVNYIANKNPYTTKFVDEKGNTLTPATNTIATEFDTGTDVTAKITAATAPKINGYHFVSVSADPQIAGLTENSANTITVTYAQNLQVVNIDSQMATDNKSPEIKNWPKFTSDDQVTGNVLKGTVSGQTNETFSISIPEVSGYWLNSWSSSFVQGFTPKISLTGTSATGYTLTWQFDDSNVDTTGNDGFVQAIHLNWVGLNQQIQTSQTFDSTQTGVVVPEFNEVKTAAPSLSEITFEVSAIPGFHIEKNDSTFKMSGDAQTGYTFTGVADDSLISNTTVNVDPEIQMVNIVWAADEQVVNVKSDLDETSKTANSVSPKFSTTEKGLSTTSATISIPAQTGYKLNTEESQLGGFELSGDSQTGYTLTGEFDTSTDDQNILLAWTALPSNAQLVVDTTGLNQMVVDKFNVKPEYVVDGVFGSPINFSDANLDIPGYKLTITDAQGKTYSSLADALKAHPTFVLANTTALSRDVQYATVLTTSYEDIEAPKITSTSKNLDYKVGDNKPELSELVSSLGLSISDNSLITYDLDQETVEDWSQPVAIEFEDYSVKFDLSAVDWSKAGVYQATVTATDVAGNSTELKFTVTVSDKPVVPTPTPEPQPVTPKPAPKPVVKKPVVKKPTVKPVVETPAPQPAKAANVVSKPEPKTLPNTGMTNESRISDIGIGFGFAGIIAAVKKRKKKN